MSITVADVLNLTRDYQNFNYSIFEFGSNKFICEGDRCESPVGYEDRIVSAVKFGAGWIKIIVEPTKPSSFFGDRDKMIDFFTLSRRQFLQSYSYLSDEDYSATAIDVGWKIGFAGWETYDYENCEGQSLGAIALFADWVDSVG